MSRCAAFALAVCVAGGVAAQEFDDVMATTSREEIQQFSDCRAAVFFHLDDGGDPRATVPLSVARTLLDQINFIMGEVISGRPPRSVDEQRAIVEFTEQFFLNFNRTIARNEAAMRDLAAREAKLQECIPWIWTSVRLQIDALVDWRRRTSDAPPAFSAEEAQTRLDATSRRLGIAE